MRKLLVAMMLAATGMVGAAAPASAATTNQHFFIVQRDDRPGTVVATGPISGTGRDVEAPNGNSATFVFPNGTVHVNHPETSDHSTFNPVACVGTDTFRGTYTLNNGTGAYAGVHGSGTYRGTATFIGRPTAHGCSEQGTTIVVVTATGHTSL